MTAMDSTAVLELMNNVEACDGATEDEKNTNEVVKGFALTEDVEEFPTLNVE